MADNSHTKAGPPLLIFIMQEMAYHGIDWDGPLPDVEDTEHIEVPAIPVPLENNDMQELIRTVCPTAPSNDYGIDIYNHTLQFVLNKLIVI